MVDLNSFKLHISILLCVFYTVSNSKGQELRPTKLNEYNQNQGLASEYITKTLVDSEGFLWIGTQEGLKVFDGKEFLDLSDKLSSKVGNSLIQDICLDKKRSVLWVLATYSNPVAIDVKSRTCKTVLSKDSKGQDYSSVWTRSIDLKNDILWIGGANTFSLYDVRRDSYLDINKIENNLNKNSGYNISKIIHDKSEQTWVFNEGKSIELISRSRNSIEKVELENIAENTLFRDAIAIENSVYLASNTGLLHLSTGSIENPPEQILDIPTVLSESEVLDLELISTTELLISTTNNILLYNRKTQEVSSFFPENKEFETLQNVYSLQLDKQKGLIWCGTQSGLWSANYDQSRSSFCFQAFTNPTFTNLYSILPFKENSVYLAGENGIYHFNTQSQNVSVVDSTSLNFLLFSDNQNNLFASNSQSLNSLDDNYKFISSQEREEVPKLLSRDIFNAAVNFNDSLIILSSIIQKGITIWNLFSKETTTFHGDSLNNKIKGLGKINNLFKSKNEEILIVTDRSVISFDPLQYLYSTHQIQKPDTKEVITNFMDMNESPDSYFIGSYGQGLIETDKQFNVKRVYTTEDGLSNNCIYRIFNINDEKMLMTTNNGLSILNLKTKKFKTYYEGDGLHGNGFEQFCGYQKDNKIYVGGPGGFTIVNTDLLPDSCIAPILYPTGITINTHDGKIDSTHLEMTSFIIPNNAFKTTLKFVSPDYKNPDRMKYRYKIDELSEEWVNLGNQNFVDLIGVNPGEYHFEVIATNSEGTDSEPLKMTLNFLPKWYQTIWFKILLLLLVAGLVYLIQRYRMIQLRKQQLIRKEIANDLHDDIGSTLNSLKIFAHLAQTDTNNKSHIEQIEESVSEATVGLRDMIWVLEDEQDSVYEIMERIKKFASPICMANNIEFVSTVKATSEKPVPKKIKRNIFLVAKECINNSVKYAECTTIKVSFEYAQSKLRLIIKDNGKGFDYDNVNMGKGLDSMQYRASQVRFECQVKSNPGKGTTTEFVGIID